MTAKATAAVLLVALGGATAIAVTSSRADEQLPYGVPPTVYRTVTETRTHHALVDGKPVGWWAHRARRNAHQARAGRITLHRIQARLHDRWAPTVDYAIDLASRVFGVSESKMRAVAYCESTLRPWVSNGRYRGLFQLGWYPFGLSPYDPIASALSTAQTVVRDGSWRQWECG